MVEKTEELYALLKAKGFKRAEGFGYYWTRARWWKPSTWSGCGDYLSISYGIWYYAPPASNPHTSKYGESTESLLAFLRNLA